MSDRRSVSEKTLSTAEATDKDRTTRADAKVKKLPPRVSGAKPGLGHAVELLRNPIGLIQRGSREIGNVFSFRLPGSDGVVILGTDNSRFIFSETDNLLSISSAYPFFRRMFAPDFYFLAEDHEEYKKQQAVVVPRFQGRQLESYLEIMDDQATSLERQLGDSGQFNLTDVFGPLVMRIAAHSFLGSGFGAKMTRDFYTEFRTFSRGMDFLTPSWLPVPHAVRSKRARDRLRKSLGAMIAERRQRPLDPPDFLQLLSESQFADGRALPELLLVNLLLMFAWAGHETTTGHITWALIDLLRNPAELLRVQAEAELVTSPISMDGVKSLKHLDNCLLETERLHPVAYIIARQAAVDFDLGGYRIRKGTRVFVSPAVTHRLPEEFRRPEDFWPDRYGLGPEGKAERQSLIGFGGGIHRCLGRQFAFLEMKVVLWRLLLDYQFTLLDPDPPRVSGISSQWPGSPCRVRYRRR